MTIAWYGHLRFKTAPLLVAILASWLIALPEYMLQVPANRYGHAEEAGDEVSPRRDSTLSRWWRAEFTAPQLKILQEVITICVFIVFNFLYLQERIRSTDFAAFGLILAAVVVMTYPRLATARAEQSKTHDTHSLLPEDVVMEPVDGPHGE